MSYSPLVRPSSICTPSAAHLYLHPVCSSEPTRGYQPAFTPTSYLHLACYPLDSTDRKGQKSSSSPCSGRTKLSTFSATQPWGFQKDQDRSPHMTTTPCVRPEQAVPYSLISTCDRKSDLRNYLAGSHWPQNSGCWANRRFNVGLPYIGTPFPRSCGCPLSSRNIAWLSCPCCSRYQRVDLWL